LTVVSFFAPLLDATPLVDALLLDEVLDLVAPVDDFFGGADAVLVGAADFVAAGAATPAVFGADLLAVDVAAFFVVSAFFPC
jgi:hypothetical protein